MNVTNKITSVLLSATTAVWLSGFAMFVPVAHAQSTTDLQSQINALLSQIAALQAQLASGSSASTGNVKCTFTRSLTVGSTGDDVKCLQQYLNDGGNAMVSASGVGSKGNETMYFGSLTAAAVAKWQAMNGVSPAVGYFGPVSRAKYAALVAGTPTPAPTPTPGPTPSGSGLTVTLAADQPASGLFGESFASRPFTKLNLTASADGDVTVKAMTVERTGQGNDAAFSGVIALDENGLRLGPAKTFGSDHRLRLTEPVVVKAGQTRSITLAGDSDADQNDYNGQLVSLSLVGVETSGATVNAAFPMGGSVMTVNSTLAIGSMTLARGSFDPAAGLTKEIGTVGYTFSGLRLTAGSNEDVLVKSIQWNQSGSAATGDLANAKVVFDGTTYEAKPSSDGKYYTAMFGTGIKIEKGLNKEMYIKSDITGGSARTVDFDLHRYADLQVVGLTYGYALLPSATEVAASADDGAFHSANPNFDAFQAYIDAGTINAQNAPTIGAQNVAVSLSNQPLGGMIVDVKGEEITVAAMNFDLSIIDDTDTGGSVETNDVTNITLVREDGTVVAGPIDGVAGGNNAIRFTDTVTFKPGRFVYTLKGKVGTDVGSNDTVAASTTPGSDWSTVRGITSGVSITPTPASAVTMSTMTVKAASLTISLTPETQSNGSTTAQTVVAGTSGYKFTNYVLDASGSGEDIRLNSLQLRNTFSSSNTADDLTNCQVYDGNTVLNTGSNVVNPANSDTSAANKTFSLDTGLIIPKGTIKTLGLKCNLVSGANASGQWQWGITDADASLVATGMTSGQSVDGSDAITSDDGRIIAAATSGTVSFALDSSSPAQKWVRAGSADNTLAVFRFNATNEDVRIDTLGLQLGTSTASADIFASNTPSDMSKVTVWNGSTKVGEALFSSTDYATATLSGVIVPKDGQVLLTVKSDIASIMTGGAGRPGHVALINYDASNSSNCSGGATTCQRGAVGVGISSGVAVGSGGTDSGTNGGRIARAIPTVSKLLLTSNTFGGTASAKPLYRFSVSAPADTNGISLYKFTFNVSTSSKDVNELPSETLDTVAPTYSNDFGVTNFQMKCYSDSGFSIASCGNTSGLLNQFGFAIGTSNSGDQSFGSSTSDMTTAPISTSGDGDDDGDAQGDGLVIDGSPEIDFPVYFNPTASSGATAEAIRIPSGETRWFELVGDIANATTTSSVTVKMQGDATYSAGTHTEATTIGSDQLSNNDDWVAGDYAFASTSWAIDSWVDNDFIWSGNSTNTGMSIDTYDWFNGFLVPGMSNTDSGSSETLSKN